MRVLSSGTEHCLSISPEPIATIVCTSLGVPDRRPEVPYILPASAKQVKRFWEIVKFELMQYDGNYFKNEN
jgi:hypothetical protein